jgi:hypothetical protein
MVQERIHFGDGRGATKQQVNLHGGYFSTRQTQTPCGVRELNAVGAIGTPTNAPWAHQTPWCATGIRPLAKDHFDPTESVLEEGSELIWNKT